MTPQIGIMQGRLSPSQDGRFQFFPKNWQAEFSLAKELGFSSIEWIYDENPDIRRPHWEFNPILNRECREEIHNLSRRHSVKINSICADYFMSNGFSTDVGSDIVLRTLIFAAKSIQVKTIVLPFLENATIKNNRLKKEIIKSISDVLGLCKLYGVKLALETDLGANDIRIFIRQFKSPYVGVCYDLGNATSYGHDLPKDIGFLGALIFEVHIKDRKVGSSQSVYLGEGDVDFYGCFRALKSIGFNGSMILQANRGEYYIDDAKRQLDFVKTKWRG